MARVLRMEVVDEAGSDERRFAAAVVSHRARLWGYCHSLTEDGWDADDLFQETLLRAFMGTSGQREKLTLPYLFRIARNARIDAGRKRKLDTVPLHGEEDAASDFVDPLETRDAVTTLVRHLPLRQQLVFVLWHAFAYTAADIAARASMTEGAVKAALHRARQALQDLRVHQGATHEGAWHADSQCMPRDEEKNVIASYLAALSAENPQLFIDTLARVNMQGDVSVHALHSVIGHSSARSRPRVVMSDHTHRMAIAA